MRNCQKTPILSASFDSLLSEVRHLSPRDRIASMIKISYRNEEEIDGIQNKNDFLMEILPLSSGKRRKEILFQLVTLYNNLDRFGIPRADLKGLKWIEMLKPTIHFHKKKSGE